MKIRCENCQTKYSIADEKVAGKVFKIKCKRCSHIIVVRGTEVEGGAEPSGGFDQKETRVFDYGGDEAAGAAPPSDAVWYLVIDREQVGPLSLADIQDRYTRAEIDADTYAWREGMGDWQRLADLDELRFLSEGGAPAGAEAPFPAAGAPDEGATQRADPADLFAAAAGGEEEGAAGDLFGGAPGAAPDEGGGLFDAPAASSGGDDLFGGAPAAAPTPSGNGAGDYGNPRVEVGPQMTGQRNENSVLFSLSNLASLATDAPKGSAAGPSGPAFQTGGSTNEGSGLIDIRAMAATMIGDKPAGPGGPDRRPEDDLPVFSGSSFGSPAAASVLLPSVATQGRPAWFWYLAGGVGVLFVAVVVLLVVVLTRDPATVAVAGGDTTAGAKGVLPEDTADGETALGGGDKADPGSSDTPSAGGDDKGATPAPAADNDGEDDEDDDADKGSDKGGDDKGSSRTVTSSRRDRDRGRGSSRDRGSSRTSRPDKGADDKGSSRTAPSGGGGGDCDEVTCLVDPSKACCKKFGGGGGSSGGSSSRSRGGGGGSDSNLPDTLTRSQVQGGINKVRGRVMACNDKYKVPGTVSVRITISGSSGRVSNADVQGKFSGTPTGKCVEAAVKRATFPKFKQNALSVTYPFIFR